MKLVLSSLLACAALAWGQGRSCEPSVHWPRARSEGTTVHLTQPTTEPALELFDRVSADLRHHYFDPAWNGLDLRSAYQDFRELVALAYNDQEVYALLSELIACLDDDHSYFWSPRAQEWSTNDFGLLTLSPAERLYVRYAHPGSPAERLGLRPRDRILSVDGQVTDLAEHLYWDAPPLRLKVRSPGETPRMVKLREGRYEPDIVPQYHRLEREPAIGYLALASFQDESVAFDVSRALAVLRVAQPPLEGLILDLRGNEGGWIDEALDIAGQFAPGDFAKEASRFGETLLVAPPGEHAAALEPLPLVVLVDGQSESSAELLAAGLQHSGRARVVGQLSAANTEIVYAYAYDDGSELWLAYSQTLRLDGSPIGATGVVPDLLIAPDIFWPEYSERDDPYLNAALELLKTPPGKPRFGAGLIE